MSRLIITEVAGGEQTLASRPGLDADKHQQQRGGEKLEELIRRRVIFVPGGQGCGIIQSELGLPCTGSLNDGRDGFASLPSDREFDMFDT